MRERYGLTVFTGGRGPRRFRAAAGLARRAEAAGFGAVWTGELYSRSATVPMAVLGTATERIAIGSNIAYGVGRAPLILAAEARDLDELTGGRIVLGLGNGTPGMMENWLGTSGEAPAVRMEELVTLLRALWRLHEGPVHHEGRFYRLHLAPTADTPPPVRAHLPIWTAGVGPRMVRAAGRVADGLVGHPMMTSAYLDEVVRPELARGAAEAKAGGISAEAKAGGISAEAKAGGISAEAKAGGISADAGRSLDGFVVMGMRMCAVDDDVEAARRRIAFAIGQYAASRVYDRLFALHGWDAAQQRIRAAAKDRDPAGMAAAVPDAAIDAIGIACTAAELPARVAEHAAAFDHLNLCAPPWGLGADDLEAATEGILAALTPAPIPSREDRR